MKSSSYLLTALFTAAAIAAGCSSSTDIIGDAADGGSGDQGSSGDNGSSGNGGSLGGSGSGSSSNGNGGSSGNTGGGSTDAGKGSTSSDAGKGSTSSDAGSGGGSDSGSTSGGGGVPTDCTQADGQIGCCDPSGVLYYCTAQNKLTSQTCTGGQVCGWSTGNGYYDCVASPGGSDPSGTSPKACGGGGGTTGGMDAGTTKDAGGGSTVTWTTIYNNIFGPSGTSTCAGSGCHTSSKSGFACGSSATSCYTGMVNSGLVTTGAGAASSALVDPNQSPLCGTLGGNMPIGHSCVTAAQITQIKSWLASGAPDN